MCENKNKHGPRTESCMKIGAAASAGCSESSWEWRTDPLWRHEQISGRWARRIGRWTPARAPE
eukprot:7087602-Alexandrium_andersonii.AAC.1